MNQELIRYSQNLARLALVAGLLAVVGMVTQGKGPQSTSVLLAYSPSSSR